MRPKLGRPRCRSKCCEEEAYDTLYVMYVEKNMSANEIGIELEVSGAHILKRLHELEIKTKGQGRPHGVGKPRRSYLWQIGDRELFHTPVKELALKYNMSWGAVEYVRRRRKVR
jgi:predicted ArsR family transcriptional regulator